MTVIAIPALQDNYIWLLRHNDSSAVVVVDPGEAEPVIRYLQTHRLHLAAILLTHHHHDHVGGAATLKRQWKAPVYGPKADNIASVTHALLPSDVVDVPEAGVTLDVLATPGHTLGQVNYYGHGCVFTGDTLFSGGCGRLFEGDSAQMWTSLKRLRALPAETRVYCGHEYTARNLAFAAQVEPDNQAIKKRSSWVTAQRAANRPTLPSTMGDEREFNPFLRADYDAVRASAEQYAGKKLRSTVAVFATLRDWKDHF